VPGAKGPSGLRTRSRVIDHQREDGLTGLVSVLSAKYTTARAMAERAVDVAVRRLRRSAAPCRTSLTVLPRATPLAGTLAEQARQVAREESAVHLDDAVFRRLDLATAGRPAPAAVEEVAAVMARELEWDAGRLGVERDRLESALNAVEAR
jgi:glycerol-3-phosphate dehydrogenase